LRLGTGCLTSSAGAGDNERMIRILLILAGLIPASWIAWRLASKKKVLPCPAAISALVEMENPIARVTRSENIVRQLDLPAGSTVADVGCGPGRVAIPMAGAVGEHGVVFAMDIQREMLEKVRAKADASGLVNLRYVEGDVREQQLDASSLDVAYSVMALGEIPDYARIFPTIFEALKPGGLFLISESRFDPHFISSSKIREQVMAAGFREKEFTGNFLAYAIVFERPAVVVK